MSEALPIAAESRSLAELEMIIERGIATFIDVGTALLEIREGRLYRQTHDTFEAYCRERWGFSRPRAYQLMEAAEVVAQLSTVVDTLPPTERHARELSRIPDAEERAAVWQAVTNEHGPSVTAADIRQMVALADVAAEVLPTVGKTQNGGRPPKDRVSEAAVAERIGIPRQTLDRARDHVSAIDDYPELEPLRTGIGGYST